MSAITAESPKRSQEVKPYNPEKGVETSLQHSGEKIFNQEVVEKEDVAAIQKRLNELYRDTEDPVGSAFVLAKQLAHLKQAGVTINKNQETVFTKLRSNVDAVFSGHGAVKGAQFLSYLKHVGGLAEKGPGAQKIGEYKELIKSAIDKRRADNSKEDLAVLLVNAKALGVEYDKEAVKQAVAQEVEHSRGARRVMQLGRAKHLGFANDPMFAAMFSEGKRQNQATIDPYKQKGSLGSYARLRYVDAYTQGEGYMSKQEQDEMIDYVRKAKPDARNRPNQLARLTHLFADMAALSRRSALNERRGRKNFEAFIASQAPEISEDELTKLFDTIRAERETSPAARRKRNDDEIRQNLHALEGKAEDHKPDEARAEEMYRQQTAEARQNMTPAEKVGIMRRQDEREGTWRRAFARREPKSQKRTFFVRLRQLFSRKR